ncbi:unnamed protein product [Chondrus crispus]|uniref:Uncharacterized protein n=1 Tax=Chondrus crispus TaxID=2769 RepID=R7QQY0_CHOCR|nr:unnamed protein product [Chondrus crispus]CDF40897.1 unnamed protein product [Chondrus crispus]|eukprot:XP_005711191.1 unnamed protein product [Chondrus crispus]
MKPNIETVSRALSPLFVPVDKRNAVSDGVFCFERMRTVSRISHQNGRGMG